MNSFVKTASCASKSCVIQNHVMLLPQYLKSPCSVKSDTLLSCLALPWRNLVEEIVLQFVNMNQWFPSIIRLFIPRLYITIVNVRTQASSKQRQQQRLPTQAWKTMTPSGDSIHNKKLRNHDWFLFSKDKQKVAAAPPSQPAVMSPTQV